MADYIAPDHTDRLVFRIFAAAVGAAFCWLVLRPLLAPLVLASLAAVIFRPVHHKVERLLGSSNWRSATVSTLLLAAAIGVPAFFLGRTFLAQLRGLLAELLGEQESRSRLAALLKSSFAAFTSGLEAIFGRGVVEGRDLGLQALARIGTSLYERLPEFLGFAGRFALATLVAVLVVFYLFLRGRHLVDWVVDLLPMHADHSRRILERLEGTVQGVFLGALATAAVQGLVGGVGFWLLGFHKAVVWGAMMAAAGLVPLVGTALVWVPATVYLAATGQPGAAVAMLVVGAIVSTVDNLIRPVLIHGRTDISPLLVFLGILGGLRSIGPMGLIYGPLLVACTVETVHIYRELRPSSPLAAAGDGEAAPPGG